MKSILLSIKPEQVANILNGEQTIEIRKKFPKDYVGWVYIYCTKDGNTVKDGLVPYENKNGYCLVNKSMFPYDEYEEQGYRLLNGKVVARFWCGKVEKIEGYLSQLEKIAKGKSSVLCLYSDELCKKSCLTYEQITKYANLDNLYAIPISKLEVFDRPRELCEFYCSCEHCGICGKYLPKRQCNKCILTKAPQNYCYIESEK